MLELEDDDRPVDDDWLDDDRLDEDWLELREPLADPVVDVEGPVASVPFVVVPALTDATPAVPVAAIPVPTLPRVVPPLPAVLAPAGETVVPDDPNVPAALSVGPPVVELALRLEADVPVEPNAVVALLPDAGTQTF